VSNSSSCRGRATNPTKLRVLRELGAYALAGVILGFSSHPARGQRQLRIRGGPQCAACRIVLEHKASLVPPSGLPAFVAPGVVIRDDRGSFYAIDVRTQNVYAFDSSGVSARLVRLGMTLQVGPPRALAVTSRETLHVIGSADQVIGRSGALARSRPLPARASVHQALGFPDGRLLLLAKIGTPELFGYPFHVIAPDGTLLRSLGSDDNAAVDDNPFWFGGNLAPAGSDQFWANDLNRYRLALWSLHGGKALTIVERDVEWFRPWATWNSRIDVAPPVPRLLSAWQDSIGRVWTLTSVASRKWRPIAGRSLDSEAPAPTVREFEEANETILEVIDPRRGVLIASQRVSQALLRFVGDDLVVGLHANEANVVSLEVLTVRLNNPTRR
jgi:hypothetical protein